MKIKFFIGMDISKDTIDVALVGIGEEVLRYRIGNDKAAIAKLLNGLRKEHGCTPGKTLLCAESMGIYSNTLATTAVRMKMGICPACYVHLLP